MSGRNGLTNLPTGTWAQLKASAKALLKKLSGSGIEDGATDPRSSLERVADVLNRQERISALTALAGAMRFSLPAAELKRTVIAFDANVILRLSGHRKSEDIVDYLRTNFEGALILPGQVVQEFWNNQFSAVDSLAASIKKRSDELASQIEKIDESYGNFRQRFESLLDEFRSSYGYVFDEKTTRRTGLLVDLLLDKASVPFVPRELLAATALARKRTKTPPGFKDDGDGDFYVWSDLLLGLDLLRVEGKPIERVALVTLDKKLDWSRDGIPHPMLSAEIAAICGASFEVVTIDELAQRLLS